MDTEAIRKEARKWVDLADDMGTVRADCQGLWLGASAFFIGNLTELVHYPAYQRFWEQMVALLQGAELEFELIGMVLRRIADEYEQDEDMIKRDLDNLYSVTPEEVSSVTSRGSSPSGGGGGHFHITV